MVGRSGKDLRVSTFGLAAKPTVTHRVQVETFLVLEPNANEDIPVRRVPALSTFPADSWPMVRNLLHQVVDKGSRKIEPVVRCTRQHIPQLQYKPGAMSELHM
jgi:hypothetical protein